MNLMQPLLVVYEILVFGRINIHVIISQFTFFKLVLRNHLQYNFFINIMCFILCCFLFNYWLQTSTSTVTGRVMLYCILMVRWWIIVSCIVILLWVDISLFTPMLIFNGWHCNFVPAMFLPQFSIPVSSVLLYWFK